MQDIKHKGLQASLQVTQDTKAHKRTALAVNALGSFIGALSVYLMVVVMFEGSLL